MPDLAKLQVQLDTSEKLHEFASHYNWDDGFEIPNWIIHNPLCDRGTVLMIYWRARPQYFCKYASRTEVPAKGWNLQNYDFVQEIEEKYLSGFYKHQSILFNPRYDTTNGMDGYDWTQEHDDEPQHREIPAEMFDPSIQDVQWEKAGKPIKPINKINHNILLQSLLEQFKDANPDKSNE